MRRSGTAPVAEPDRRCYVPCVPGHDIVVVGASAGGVEALEGLVSQLPAGLPAAVFVVMHFSAESPSVLPRILAGAGRRQQIMGAMARRSGPGASTSRGRTIT